MGPIPSTKLQEDLKRDRQSVSRGAFRILKRAYGRVIEVGDKRRVKVTLDDGRLVKAGQWVPLKNSPMDIVHRFGSVRAGMRVEVITMGEPEREVQVELIGAEDEGDSALLLDPTTVLSPNPLYGIFI